MAYSHRCTFSRLGWVLLMSKTSFEFVADSVDENENAILHLHYKKLMHMHHPTFLDGTMKYQLQQCQHYIDDSNATIT